MIYEIAGLKVEMEPRFDRLKRQSDAYKSSGEPDLHLDFDVRGCADTLTTIYSDEDLEYIYSSAKFCRDIIKYGRFFLHASAVVYNGEAYLFSAPSGVGKSTHTALWLKEFPGSYILNDDKPVIFPSKGGVSVWGTPFAGKTDLQLNREVPLRAICFLRQGEKNNISPVSEDAATALILANTYRPKTCEDMSLLLDMTDRVLAETAVFEMSCTRQREAAITAYNAMKGK